MINNLTIMVTLIISLLLQASWPVMLASWPFT